MASVPRYGINRDGRDLFPCRAAGPNGTGGVLNRSGRPVALRGDRARIRDLSGRPPRGVRRVLAGRSDGVDSVARRIDGARASRHRRCEKSVLVAGQPVRRVFREHELKTVLMSGGAPAVLCDGTDDPAAAPERDLEPGQRDHLRAGWTRSVATSRLQSGERNRYSGDDAVRGCGNPPLAMVSSRTVDTFLFSSPQGGPTKGELRVGSLSVAAHGLPRVGRIPHRLCGRPSVLRARREPDGAALRRELTPDERRPVGSRRTDRRRLPLAARDVLGLLTRPPRVSQTARTAVGTHVAGSSGEGAKAGRAIRACSSISISARTSDGWPFHR